MDSKTKKLALIGAAVVAVGAGVTLALQAFNENLVFFFSPTQVAAKEAPTGRTFRLGGVVEPGSVKRQADGVTVTFGITDTAKIVPVQYKGILPDLFAEGQGVVAQGQYKSLFCHMDQFLSLDCSISPIISHFFGGWKEIFAILPQVCYDDGRYGKI